MRHLPLIGILFGSAFRFLLSHALAFLDRFLCALDFTQDAACHAQERYLSDRCRCPVIHRKRKIPPRGTAHLESQPQLRNRRNDAKPCVLLLDVEGLGQVSKFALLGMPRKHFTAAFTTREIFTSTTSSAIRSRARVK